MTTSTTTLKAFKDSSGDVFFVNDGWLHLVGVDDCLLAVEDIPAFIKWLGEHAGEPQSTTTVKSKIVELRKGKKHE